MNVLVRVLVALLIALSIGGTLNAAEGADVGRAVLPVHTYDGHWTCSTRMTCHIELRPPPQYSHRDHHAAEESGSRAASARLHDATPIANTTTTAPRSSSRSRRWAHDREAGAGRSGGPCVARSIAPCRKD